MEIMSRILIMLALMGNVCWVAWGISSTTDLKDGFKSLQLKQNNFRIQRPYDVPKEERYSFISGVHKCWVYSTDKPHTPTSKTLPRTEISIHGYAYRTGVWQFEGYGYVPKGTSGVCIMQVFGTRSTGGSSTLMVRVYNGTLTYYRRAVLENNIYDRWFRLNVIHDADTNKLRVYVDGKLKLETTGRPAISHNFKCGVYAQHKDSSYMEARWKNLKVLRKL
ncbi:Citrate-binding protein [Linum grandiflorum]